MMRKRDQAAIDALAEHRRREDEAPRLQAQADTLLSLRLRLDDLRESGRLMAASYVRPIVVGTAPAHFEMRCMEPRCDGRHDVTQSVMRALRQRSTSFDGKSDCQGMIGDNPCTRTMAFHGDATYRP